MKVIKISITLQKLRDMATQKFGNLVKAVVDVKQRVMAVDGELHADEEALLLSKGSKQENLWGINLYPELPNGEWVEFDSMINLRPSVGNMSRGIDDPKLRDRIIKIVSSLVKQ